MLFYAFYSFVDDFRVKLKFIIYYNLDDRNEYMK